MMHSHLLSRDQWLPRPVEEVFAFFCRPENLQAITPPWLDFRIVQIPDSLTAGSLIRYRLRLHHIPIWWTTVISEWDPPHRFVDRQLSGPYRLWVHEHEFVPERGGTMLRDRVTYALPFGFLGEIVHRTVVKGDLERIFDFRAETMRRLFPA